MKMRKKCLYSDCDSWDQPIIAYYNVFGIYSHSNYYLPLLGLYQYRLHFLCLFAQYLPLYRKMFGSFILQKYLSFIFLYVRLPLWNSYRDFL